MRSQISTGAQSKQIRHRVNLLEDRAPLRGFCCCYCFRLTQLLKTGQPHVLTPFYLLPLQDDFLYFSLFVCLVHLDPRRFFLAAAACFRHNFDLVTRGMNRASIIYAMFLVSSRLTVFLEQF